MTDDIKLWDEETQLVLDKLDESIQHDFELGMMLRVSAKSMEDAAKKKKVEANEKLLVAFAIADIKSVKSPEHGQLIYMAGEKPTLDKKQLQVKLLEAGVSAKVIAECIEAATKKKKYESVTFKGI